MSRRQVTTFLFSMALLAGCSGKEELSLGTGSSGGITVPTEGTEEVTVPPGTFSLILNTPLHATYVLHKAGVDFSAPCAIDPEATGADRFIDCEIDVDELDLLMYGLSFQSQISSLNCAHVSYTPYFYMSAPAGQGPTQVSYTNNLDTGVITEDPNGFSHNGDAYCPFNYTHIASGPNCCTGEFTQIATTISSGITTVRVTTENWGGNPASCVSGAGIMDPLSDDGWPLTIYTANTSTVGTGLQITKVYDMILGDFTSAFLRPRVTPNDIVVPPDHPLVNQSINRGGFGFLGLFYANFYNPAIWGGNPPDAMIEPHYVFTCLDTAHEETARIRLTVREWNVKGSISAANMANADMGGWDVFNRPNNDMGDWDDTDGMINPAPPPYSVTYDPEDYLYLREGYPYHHLMN